MGRKEEFFYPSSSGKTQIHAVRYTPDGEIKAVLQISHGMVEFIERYEEFAQFLNEHNILVTGNDHLGHGGSINSKADYGYFAEVDGNGAVLDDLHKLTVITKELYPNVPYFLLGHSMGSFYARQYLCEYGSELDGAIIMGTGHMPLMLVKAGMVLSKIIATFRGWRYRSKFINNMAFGGYNKRFEPGETKSDWLSKNKDSVNAYLADERCTFVFTLNGYYNMLKGISRLYDRDLLDKMPKDLPVFFMSGEDDPVGEFKEGVLRAIQTFYDAGMKNVSAQFYPDDRHEILNELDRAEVYEDILAWMTDIIQEKEAKQS